MPDANLSSILTAAQNVATALGSATQAFLAVNGTQNRAAMTATALLKSGPGRVATVVVTVAGAAGSIYDANDATLTTGKIYVIPAVIGIYALNMPVTNGIVVAPGAGQTVTVSYS